MTERHPFDVVILYGPPWGSPTRVSKHHLAGYLATRGHRVLYVAAPLGVLSLARQRAAALPGLRAAWQRPRRVSERLWAMRPFNPVPYHGAARALEAPWLNWLGQQLLAPAIRQAAAGLGFRRPVVIAGLPHAVDLVPRIPHRLLVYHCADDYASVHGFPRGLPALDERLCRAADLVVTTGPELRDERLAFNATTVCIPNGADVAHFSKPVPPAADTRDWGHPTIGFVGALAEWVDLELVAFLAASRPAWRVVLIGPEGERASALQGLRNVLVTGPRPYATIPSYLAAMDVALVPFRRGPVTQKADPIKTYEYLAAGVPVVATDLPALRRLGPVVRLAGSHEQFLHQVDAAIAGGRSEGKVARQEEAARHGWDARFAEIETLIRERLVGRCFPPMRA